MNVDDESMIDFVKSTKTLAETVGHLVGASNSRGTRIDNLLLAIEKLTDVVADLVDRSETQQDRIEELEKK